jgi:hypothetical protein
MSLTATEHSSSPSPSIPSPSTSEGNQMGYYYKYGGWPPAGPNSAAAIHARVLELLGSSTKEQEKVSDWQQTISAFSSVYYTRESRTKNVEPRLSLIHSGHLNGSVEAVILMTKPALQHCQIAHIKNLEGNWRLSFSYKTLSASHRRL